jgi:putative chitinase
MITADQLRRIMPAGNPEIWQAPLDKAMGDHAIDTALRAATFLAHVAVESRELQSVLENMSYSAERLTEVWPNRFPTVEVAAPFAHNAERLGNFVYANRLGNGPPASGDGFRYRGRGLLQATGRDHYREAGQALGLDLLGHPELLEQPSNAATEAAWWWQKQGLNAIADSGDFRHSTLVINGGLTGFADRVAHWRTALGVLGASLPAAADAALNQKVQHALNLKGAAPPLTEDGIWGPMSEAAADQFRTGAGLAEATGIDVKLLQALGLV